MDKRSIERLGRSLMKEHGLTDAGWTFGFDQAKVRAGCCYWEKKRITVSPIVMKKWTEDGVRNMLLHEIAHGLCGRSAGHGPEWVRKARSIGCDGQRLYSDSNADTPGAVKPKWVATAPCCGRKSLRHKRMKLFCGRCNKGTYRDEFKLVYTPNV